VYFTDNTFKSYQITSEDTVLDVVHMVAKKLNVPASNNALYQMKGDQGIVMPRFSTITKKFIITQSLRGWMILIMHGKSKKTGKMAPFLCSPQHR